jgi:hypothetical protein
MRQMKLRAYLMSLCKNRYDSWVIMNLPFYNISSIYCQVSTRER